MIRTHFIRLCIVFIVFPLFLFVVYHYKSCKDASYSYRWTENSPNSWPKFLLPPVFEDELWKANSCFISRQSNTIANLVDRVKEWTQSEEYICKEIGNKLQSIYSIDVRLGQIRIPATFGPQIARWLGKKADLMQVKNQVLVHIFNRYTYQHTIYTPLRARRPLGKQNKDPKLIVAKLVQDSKGNYCDFCNYGRRTAEDTFGRLESRYAITASNVFKMDHWHGLVILRDHNPLNLTRDVVLDAFNLTMRWLHTAHSFDPTYKFPSLVWDMLPRAGASQVHPHLQVFLAPKQYYGKIESLRQAAHFYERDFPNSNLFSDVAAIHSAAGLSVRLGDAIAIVDLVGNKNREIVIMSANCSENMYTLLYLTIKIYFEKYHIYSFSSVMVFPTLGDGDVGKGKLPAIIRISSRGNPDDVVSDMSSFELYLVNNVSVDPYEVISMLTVAVKEFVSAKAAI